MSRELDAKTNLFENSIPIRLLYRIWRFKLIKILLDFSFEIPIIGEVEVHAEFAAF